MGHPAEQTEARRPEGLDPPLNGANIWRKLRGNIPPDCMKPGEFKLSLDKTKASAGQMKFQFLWFLKKQPTLGHGDVVAMDETTQSEIKMQNVKFKKKKRKQQTKEKNQNKQKH